MARLGFPRSAAAIGICAFAFALLTGAGCAKNASTGGGGTGGTTSTTTAGTNTSSTGGTGGHGGSSSSSTSGSTTASTSSASSGTGGAGGAAGAGGAGGAGGGFVPPPGTAEYPAEMEPNNTEATANALEPGTKGFTASIWPLGDVDNFAIPVVVGGSSVSVATSDGMGGCPAGAMTYVRVVDGMGNELAFDGGMNGCVSFTPATTPALAGLPVGTYYVHVENALLATIPRYILDLRVTAPACGDGVVQVAAGEQCDDGNVVSGDGCSSTCQIESGHYLDETEPNDTQATGNDIDGYAGAVGQINPVGDVDWYTVDVVVAGSSITAEIGDGFGGCPLGFDSDLALYSPAMAQLVDDDGSGVSPCSKIAPQVYPAAANLPIGTYALAVSRISSEVQPYYVLKVKVAPPGCGDGVIEAGEQCDPGMPVPGCSAMCQLTGDFIPETEPNDTQALANPLGGHAGFIAAIQPVGDLDYFSFQVPGPKSLVFIQTSDGIGGCPVGFDSVIALFNPMGTLLVTDDNGGVDLCSKISPLQYPKAMNLPGGTYRVRVGFNGNSATQQLYVVTISVAQPGCGDGILEAGEQCDDGPNNGAAGDGCSATCQSLAPWEIEPNNSTATATPEWPGFSTWKAAISPLGDHDYFSFTLAAAGKVTLVTHDVDAPLVCSSDTVLYLLDHNGTEIGFDDDSGPGPGAPNGGQCSLISMMAVPAGTYYAEVTSYNDMSLIPSYQLDLTVQ